LQKVAKEKSVLCIQEHWLWSFDENYFNKIIPQMECQNTLFNFAPSMLQVIRSIFWILLFPSVTNEDSAVLLGGLVSLKNTSSVVLAVLI
jgi:hypothetical protein